MYFEKALALMEHTKEKMRFSRYRVFHVVQKHYLGDVEIKTAIWLSAVSQIFVPKIVNISWFVSKL